MNVMKERWGSKWLDLEDFESFEEIEEEHYKRQVIESNHQMIDNCNTLICYVNKNIIQAVQNSL